MAEWVTQQPSVTGGRQPLLFVDVVRGGLRHHRRCCCRREHYFSCQLVSPQSHQDEMSYPSSYVTIPSHLRTGRFARFSSLEVGWSWIQDWSKLYPCCPRNRFGVVFPIDFHWYRLKVLGGNAVLPQSMMITRDLEEYASLLAFSPRDHVD